MQFPESEPVTTPPTILTPPPIIEPEVSKVHGYHHNKLQQSRDVVNENHKMQDQQSWHCPPHQLVTSPIPI